MHLGLLLGQLGQLLLELLDLLLELRGLGGGLVDIIYVISVQCVLMCYSCYLVVRYVAIYSRVCVCVFSFGCLCYVIDHYFIVVMLSFGGGLVDLGRHLRDVVLSLYKSLSLSLSICIYIYIERERVIIVCVYTYIYIYMYIHV